MKTLTKEEMLLKIENHRRKAEKLSKLYASKFANFKCEDIITRDYPDGSTIYGTVVNISVRLNGDIEYLAQFMDGSTHKFVIDQIIKPK